MVNRETMERLVAELQAKVNKTKYSYALNLVNNSLLRMDIKTGIIDELDDEDDLLQYAPFDCTIVFPEIMVWALGNGDSFDELSPFEQWFLFKLFNTDNEENTLKAVRKWNRNRKRKAELLPSTSPQPHSAPAMPTDKATITEPSNDDIITPDIEPIERKPLPKKRSMIDDEVYNHDFIPNW